MIKWLLLILLALPGPAFAVPPAHPWDRRMQWQNFSRLTVELCVRAKMGMTTEDGAVTFRVTDPANKSAEVSRPFKGSDMIRTIYPDDFSVDLTLEVGTYRWQAAVQGHVVRSGKIIVSSHAQDATRTIVLTDDAFPHAKQK